MGFVSAVARAVFPLSKKQRMFIAAQNGDIKTVQDLLYKYRSAVFWLTRNGGGQTPLMLAAGSGRLDVCRLLIARGADVHRRDDRGCTAFRHVIDGMMRCAGVQTPAPKFKVELAALEATAKYLLEQGADIDTKCSDGHAPLNRTIMGFGDIARFLVRNGADIASTDALGATILMCAASAKSAAVVEALLEAGASVLARNAEGKNAQDIATESDSFKYTRQHEATLALLRQAAERQLQNASLAEKESILRQAEESVVAQQPIVLMPQLKFRPWNSQMIGFKR
ncbi:MAG: ankyrin repeat domain-containing protein [Alphaproteobacteria bacterium]